MTALALLRKGARVVLIATVAAVLEQAIAEAGVGRDRAVAIPVNLAESQAATA